MRNGAPMLGVDLFVICGGSVIMRKCLEMLVDGFAVIGHTVLGTDEQMKALWQAVSPFVAIVLGSLVTVTVIAGWASLMAQLIR